LFAAKPEREVLMGLDHTKLTYLYQGFNQRLTGVRGNVVEKVLA